MIDTPKSLTAIVHVKFNYRESEAKAPDSREIEILSRILDQASSLSPEMQETMVKFADYLGGLGDRAEPSQN